MNHFRVVKRRAEQRSENQCFRVCEPARFLFRMEIIPVRLVCDRPPRSVSPDEHRCNRRFRAADRQAGIHPVFSQFIPDDFSRRVRSQGAEDARFQSQFCRRDGSVHRFPAGAQRAGFSPVSGSGNRRRIKSPDNGIHQGRPDTDQIVLHCLFTVILFSFLFDYNYIRQSRRLSIPGSGKLFL